MTRLRGICLESAFVSQPMGLPWSYKVSWEKSSPHKVKVIFFSETGECAAPFVGQAALNYWPYAAFAFMPWREEESSFWWNVIGVESAPAIVFLKEHGVKPIVYHGPANNSWFVDIMEQNKHQELPQLRSVTSMGLGCDAGGYSRAGNETAIWYYVILAGRSSPELNKMRATLRRIQEALSTVDNDQLSSLAAVALKKKRLTFTWLDGEAQQDDEDRPNQRRKKRAVSNQDCPPSITDTEPKDAYSMPLSNSDS